MPFSSRTMEGGNLRLLGIDLETTGLDLKKDRILKFGAILMDTKVKTPLFEKEWTLWHDSYPDTEKEALEVHHITRAQCVEFGQDPLTFYPELVQFLERLKIDFIVAHNGTNFDFPMLEGNLEAFYGTGKSYFKKLKKMDTALDVPYPPKMATRKLVHLAAEHGFLNPFPHSTLSDIRTMFKVLEAYSLEEVVARSESPALTLCAKVVYETRELAKARRFYWDQEKQRWLKKVKACDLNFEIENADFEIITL
jgi:DNA polymerase III alpha subunit (gram-positive type)